MKKLKALLTKAKNAVVAGVLSVLLALGLYNLPDAGAQVTNDVLTWTMPTQRSDGTALPIGEIASTTIAYAASAAGPFANPQVVTPPTTTLTLSRGPGTRCYVAFVTDTAGRVGAQTPTPACKTVLTAPNAPTNLQVN